MKKNILRQLYMLSKRLIYVFLLQLFLGTVLMAHPGNAQRKTIEEVKVSLNLKEKTLLQFFRQVESKTDFKFTLNNNRVDLRQRVTVVDNNTVYKVLESVSLQTRLNFVQVNENIHVNSWDDGDKEQAVEVVEAVDVTVSGTVTDADGNPLPGVTVSLPGTTVGTATDLDGRYSLMVPEGSTLVFSFIGFETQSIEVGDRSVIDVTLIEDMASLDEVVVVGYGVQKKASLTSAISSMEGNEISSIPMTDISNSLGGRLSGVIVKQTSGEPGRDGSDIFIRGISTTGSSQPLLVVDGIPRSFQQLDPNSIESFTVLKDAAAVAPYGVAGANGVILVTTKRGESGTPSLTYNGYIGVQNPTVIPELVNGFEFATLKNIVAENAGLPKPYSENALQKFKDGSDPDAFPPYKNPWGEITNQNALISYHNMEISGGSEKIKYYASLGYQFQNGMWKTTNSERFNLAMNLDAQITNTTNISLNINGRIKTSKYPPSDHPNLGSARILELIKYAHPQTGPYFFSNGMFGTYASAAILGSGYQENKSTGIYTQLSIEQEIPFIPGLEVKGTVAYDPSYDNYKSWRTPLHVAAIDTSQEPYVISDGIFGETKPYLNQDWEQAYQITYQASLNYAKSFGFHNLNVIGVFEAIANNYSSLGASRRNFNLFIDEISMGSSSNVDMTTSGTSSEARQVGLVYRAAYNYNEKYLFEASGRYDGHYYFAPENRFGFFPAFSIGWRLSEENFLKNRVSWLDNIKLRASYGEVGALAGSAFQYLSTYNVSGPGYVIGGNAVQIISERSEPNPNITWERARKSDFGLELSFWEGMVQFEADYFYEKRSNMLVAPSVITPVEYGIGLSQVNAGVMENRGIDLSGGIRYDVSTDLKLSLHGTFTYAKNKVLETFETSATYENPNRRRTGKSLGTQFGYESIGYFQPNDFDSEGNLNPNIATQPWGAVQPGDIRYRDVNGDGKIDLDDEVAIGDPSTPLIMYGISPKINYKNFSLDLLFLGADKASYYFAREAVWPFWNGQTAYVDNFDYWTPDNPDARHPRLTAAPTVNNRQDSSHWMEDVGYLRLKSATLAFNLPLNILERAKIAHAQVYASGQNIFTWTQLINIDPEISNLRGNTYPQQKVISIGLRLTF